MMQLPLCTNALTGDDNATTLVPRNGALDQQQVALGIDANDFEVLRGAAHVTHVAGHLLALEDAARRLVLADGTRRAVRQRVTVGGVLGAEIVALDGTGKSFTDRRANDVDLLAFLEEIDLEFLARLEFPFFRAVVSLEAKFGNQVAGFNLRLGKVAGFRLWTRGTPCDCPQ